MKITVQCKSLSSIDTELWLPGAQEESAESQKKCRSRGEMTESTTLLEHLHRFMNN